MACTHTLSKRDNHQGCMCSLGNFLQCSGITYLGTESEKLRAMCICISESTAQSLGITAVPHALLRSSRKSHRLPSLTTQGAPPGLATFSGVENLGITLAHFSLRLRIPPFVLFISPFVLLCFFFPVTPPQFARS